MSPSTDDKPSYAVRTRCRGWSSYGRSGVQTRHYEHSVKAQQKPRALRLVEEWVIEEPRHLRALA